MDREESMGPERLNLRGREFPSRVLTDMSSGVLVLDRRGGIVYMNPPASRMLEAGEAKDGGRLSVLSQEGIANDEFNDYILEAIRRKDVTHTGTVHFTAPSGRRYVFQMSSSYLKGNADESEIVVTFTDETEAALFRLKRDDASRCFIIGIVCVCLWTLVFALWEFLGRPVSVDFLTHGAEVMGLVLMYFIFKYTSFTKDEMGIVLEQPWKTVREALIISAGAVALLAAVKAAGRWVDPSLFNPGRPFVDFSLFTWHQIAYIFIAGIQEFIARCILQNNIRRIMVGKHPTLIAIVLSSMMFATLHLQHGFVFMIGAGVLGGLEGILYDRQKNIYGVWIVHWFFGVAGTLLGLVAVAH